MNPLDQPRLTDGVIFLKPLIPDDVSDHLAGEDDEMAKWVSGGRSTLANVKEFIQNCPENRRNGGPRRTFGIFDCATTRLVGFIEANLAFLRNPNQVNVSYGVFLEWRGQGLALRAIELMDQYLRIATEARQMVLRIAPTNSASLRIAEKGGFTFCGVFDEPEGRLLRYVRDLRADGSAAIPE
jgi:RimJ/RimL family protein N-acetyltransferase